jgi:xanthine dehydrogenase accessory factor
MDLVSELKRREEPFAVATVVRTVSVTAAKAGAKAVILADGTIEGGWIGGGCARAAVVKAAREALLTGEPRLVSVQPPDVLAAAGVSAGDQRDGVSFARNMCPSQGTMDIFVEPVTPRPNVVVYGSSPVAVALATLAGAMGYAVTVCAPQEEQSAFATADRRITGFAPSGEDRPNQYVVVSTQGRGDEPALRAALAVKADYRAFVGSRRKMAAIRTKLAAEGFSEDALNSIRAPAGLDIGAITPDEIALSIISEIVQHRRGMARMPGRQEPCASTDLSR